MQSGKGGNVTVLAAPLDEDEESLITSSRSSLSSASTEESEVASLAVTQTYCVEAAGDAAAGSAVGCKWKPEWEKKVSIDFKEGNAMHFLHIA